MTGDLVIEPFQPGSAEQKKAFAELNREWLEKYFHVEPFDEKIFADPEKYILAPGGFILLARAGSRFVGSGALLAHPDGSYELGRMAVTPDFQGKGIGRIIAKAVINLARKRGAQTLYVVSNTKLTPAMTLYRSLGFVDSAEDLHSHYERGNITLEKVLATENDIIIERLNPSNAEQKAAFAALNREWIEKYFGLEPVDEAVLADPEKHILAAGGAILLARVDGKYVGTVALYAHEDGMFELAKMGVTPAWQGRGIGRRLAEELIALARARGLATLYITSNTTLESAQRLYRDMGFVTSSTPLHSYYQRGNITLELQLQRQEEAVA